MSSRTRAADEYDFIRKRMEELRPQPQGKGDVSSERARVLRWIEENPNEKLSPVDQAVVGRLVGCVTGSGMCHRNVSKDCLHVGKCLYDSPYNQP